MVCRVNREQLASDPLCHFLLKGIFGGVLRKGSCDVKDLGSRMVRNTLHPCKLSKTSRVIVRSPSSKFAAIVLNWSGKVISLLLL